MGKMGSSRHLTRYAAPVFWPMLRRKWHWVVKPGPGSHPLARSIPLLLIIRDMLGYAKTAREARKIIGEGQIKVDGRIRRDYKYPVGIMDVIEIVTSNQNFRLIPYPVKHMILHPISKEEASYKLVRIENKTTVKNGHIQLNLHDGRNILVQVSDPTNPTEDVYKTFDVLKIAIPEQQILDHYKFEVGALAIIVDGRNVGRVGKIVEVTEMFKRRLNIVTLEDKNGDRFQTIQDYIFIIGRDKPEISLPEGAWQ